MADVQQVEDAVGQNNALAVSARDVQARLEAGEFFDGPGHIKQYNPSMPAAAQTTPSISAVLPAYNEAAIIERTVRDVAEVLGQLTTDFEVIVTNDGSRDRTAEILAALQAAEPALNLHVVAHPSNRGYGAALASGFDAARKDLVF